MNTATELKKSKCVDCNVDIQQDFIKCTICSIKNIKPFNNEPLIFGKTHAQIAQMQGIAKLK